MGKRDQLKLRYIVIAVAIAFLFFMFLKESNADYSTVTPGAYNTNHNQSHYFYQAKELGEAHSISLTEDDNPTSSKHDILQTKLKGYRESTYWGNEHTNHDLVKDMNDDEFGRYVEEVEIKDADIYWGAEY